MSRQPGTYRGPLGMQISVAAGTFILADLPEDLVARSDAASASVAYDGATNTGAVSVVFGPVDPSMVWEVTEISVSTDPQMVPTETPPAVAVYKGKDPIQPGPLTFEFGSPQGASNVADGSALQVASNESIMVRWTGMPLGTRGVARVQYAVYLKAT